MDRAWQWESSRTVQPAICTWYSVSNCRHLVMIRCWDLSDVSQKGQTVTSEFRCPRASSLHFHHTANCSSRMDWSQSHAGLMLTSCVISSHLNLCPGQQVSSEARMWRWSGRYWSPWKHDLGSRENFRRHVAIKKWEQYSQEEKAVSQDETSHPQGHGRSQEKDGQLHKGGNMKVDLIAYERQGQGKKQHTGTPKDKAVMSWRNFQIVTGGGTY